MNPNFVVYVNPNVLDKAALAVKNLQHLRYAPLVSSNSPRLSEVKILSTEKTHHGVLFDWLFTPFIPRDWSKDVSEISVALWYNCDMEETDLKVLGDYFSTILLGYKKDFGKDSLSPLLQPFVMPPTFQSASAASYPAKRPRDEDEN